MTSTFDIISLINYHLHMKPRNRQEELHWNHKIDFQKHLTKPRRSSNHSPELKTRIQCKKCNVYIRWPSSDEIKHWHKTKHKNFTLNEFTHDFMKNGIKSPYWEPREDQVIWLNVKYEEKEQVKKYGAMWYKPTGQWYCLINNKNLEHLLPWISNPELDRLHEMLSIEGNYKPYYG